MKTHDLKIEKKYFNDVIAERKKFEVRKNDRDYQVNDILSLNEYDKDILVDRFQSKYCIF